MSVTRIQRMLAPPTKMITKPMMRMTKPVPRSSFASMTAGTSSRPTHLRKSFPLLMLPPKRDTNSAIMTMVTGLAISEGCRVRLPILIQERAPFDSKPRGVMGSKIIVTASASSAAIAALLEPSLR